MGLLLHITIFQFKFPVSSLLDDLPDDTQLTSKGSMSERLDYLQKLANSGGEGAKIFETMHFQHPLTNPFSIWFDDCEVKEGIGGYLFSCSSMIDE